MGQGAALLICLLALAGCTVVRLGEGPHAPVRLYPGIAIVKVAPGTAARVISVRSLGLAVAANTATLGFGSSDIALIPPDQCSLILWKPHPATIATLHRLMPEATICTTKEKAQ